MAVGIGMFRRIVVLIGVYADSDGNFKKRPTLSKKSKRFFQGRSEKGLLLRYMIRFIVFIIEKQLKSVSN